MAKREETELGFTRGRVARELRQVLYRELTDTQVNTIAVVLLCHLLVENRLNRVLFTLLSYDLPKYGGTQRKLNKKIEDGIWKNIREIPFIRKLQIIYPALDVFVKGLPKMLRDINRVRNQIFHGRISRNGVFFREKSIWQEDGLEKYFESSQDASSYLSKFYELIASDRAVRERWAKRLQELGEPLF